ncbi:hypothetical protein [Streptomyces sp. e14]|uniref:hypothetical protein n=1 Tax=unclassified Streptomyces TaxID=2593676 RepID=UPI0001D05A63|nr:hypothetical protein [Streptomyces sp. e14]EFF90911.1 hypothetical protein SSTG_01229 [Streptomyces sp. e14]
MRTKANATLIALAFAAGSVMFSAPAASAAAYCSGSGWTATNEPMERCTSLDNGILYNKQISGSTIYTTYSKTGGSTISAKLGYIHSGTTTYAAAVSIASGQTVKKSFSVSSGWYCDSIIGVMSANGTKYQTPATHC